jgi:L-fuconolactonase
MTVLSRRDFIRGASGLTASQQIESLLPALNATTGASHSAKGSPTSPVIDTHIHLYDPRRPGGIPWPAKANRVLYRPSLPPRYRRISEPFGVVGAVAIECSPLIADNDWLLRTAKADTLIVGVIGDLDPALSEFPQQLDRLREDPLFLGIRYGNLWGRDLENRLKEGSFVGNLKLLARHQLLLESANPDPALIANLLQLTALVPNLQIILDHLPQAVPSKEPLVRETYLRDLRALSQRANVFVKGSEVLHWIDGTVSIDLSHYRAWLDEIWDIFGEDRLIFGSDWPNSDQMATFANTFSVIQQYLSMRGSTAAEKFFWRNSIKAYRWKLRNAAQSQLFSILGSRAIHAAADPSR